MADNWRSAAEQLAISVRGRGSSVAEVSELLDAFNGYFYPLEGLKPQDAERVVSMLLQSSHTHTSTTVSQLAQLASSLFSQQKVLLSAGSTDALLQLFLLWLPRTSLPTELLYASAALTQAGAAFSSNQVEELLTAGGVLLVLAFREGAPLETQRAALHLITSLCNRFSPPPPLLHSLLEAVLQRLLVPLRSPHEALPRAKLLLSLLRCAQAVLLRLSSPLHPSPLHSWPLLPAFLASLKAHTVLGLPGQPHTIASIQLPIHVPTPHPQAPPRSPSVAGPHHRRRQHSRGRGRGRGREREVAEQQASSDSESAVVTRPVGRPPSLVCSSSDSEVSDGESTAGKLRATNSKLRLQAHACLTTIFQSLDRHTVFSYWLSFLPDGPRPPSSPPSLLTCLLKDPSPKCRGAAAGVLCALLEGAKPYLAAANDRPLPSQPFTPYSSTLGGVVRELHTSLLQASASETHPTTLTQTVKCLAVLVANAPYHQLSEGYITRVASGLLTLASHRDTDVRVACLTCYGAMVSVHPPLGEVERWLGGEGGGGGGGPWIMTHCVALLKTQGPLSLLTEALQVLTALLKFYFSSIDHCWGSLQDLALQLLSQTPEALHQHTLKMLEEMCRALSTLPPSPPITLLWEQLLSGPLPLHLHTPTPSPLPSLACSVLATLGPHTLTSLSSPLHTLTLTLPLSLCTDETTPPTLLASAVRVLGVFVVYDCLKEDVGFLVDCHSAVLRALRSSSLPVRAQAAWALANLTDSLSSPHTLPPSLLPHTFTAVGEAIKDNDKVKCNGVRAVGNLLRMLSQQMLESCGGAVGEVSSQLAKCINAGSMKSRWNACYACHSAFSNSVFTSYCQPSAQELLSALCVAVQTCKNFKVRSNAALALGSPASYRSASQFAEVWVALVRGLEGSEHQPAFSEFKHANILRTQLCMSLCHLLSVMTKEQAPSVSTHPLPDTGLRHLREFLHSTHSKTGEHSDPRSKEVVVVAMGNLRVLGAESSLHQLFQSALQEEKGEGASPEHS